MQYGIDRYMEPKLGYTLKQLWEDSEPTISKKTTTSCEIQTNDVLRAVAAIQNFSSPTPPDSPFLRALGTTAALKAPPQTDTLRWRNGNALCENKLGRPTINHKDGGEMLIVIVLDRPLAEAKALVDDPAAFTRETTRILREKQSHPIPQMMKLAESSDPPPTTAAGSSCRLVVLSGCALLGLFFCLSVSLVDLAFACFLCFLCSVSTSHALTQALNGDLFDFSFFGFWWFFGWVVFCAEWNDTDTALS